jgi:DnaJ-class molecular chaperone
MLSALMRVLCPQQCIHVSCPTPCRHGDAVTKDQPAGPLVVVLTSAPHPVFSRRGASDLKAKLKLPLLNALTGGCVRLDTLDGR